MIAYESLCQAIADWKAGARPSAASSHAHMQVQAPAGEPQAVDEIESGLVEADDEGYEAYEAYGDHRAQEQPAAEGEYAEAQYAEVDADEEADADYGDAAPAEDADAAPSDEDDASFEVEDDDDARS